MASNKKTPRLFSVGEFAAAAGVSTDTVRAWERRYGIPAPQRLPSGHRRYTPEQLRWMRRVVAVVANGHRPSDVVRLPEPTLDALVPGAKIRSPQDVDGWMQWVREFDGDSLGATLQREHEDRGAIDFAFSVARPLLTAVDEAVQAGDLGARHERFLHELLHDLLRGARAALGNPTGGPRILVCALGDPRSDIPLQTAALIAAEKGFRVRVLGRDATFEETLLAASEMDLDGVFAPVTLDLTDAIQFARLRRLRDALSAGAGLCVGWPGRRIPGRAPRGVVIVRELGSFELWLRRMLGPRLAVH